MKTVQIGVVGVDSGQLVICDPCYIDSEWEKEDFEDIRKYRHKTTGDILEYRVDFDNYESPIEKYDGQTMNQLSKTGEWQSIDDVPAENEFCYNACCKATLSKRGHGQLYYKAGHEGVGVVFSTAFGDGVFPVYAHYNNAGDLTHVSVRFDL
jgi:hypothetical protein